MTTAYLTLQSADHRAALDDDLTGRWENARDDIVAADEADIEPTPVMEDIDAVLAWLAANDTGAAYPRRLTVTGGLGAEQQAQLRVSLENLADLGEFDAQLEEDDHMTPAQTAALATIVAALKTLTVTERVEVVEQAFADTLPAAFIDAWTERYGSDSAPYPVLVMDGECLGDVAGQFLEWGDR